MSEPTDRTLWIKADERQLKMHLFSGIVLGVGKGYRDARGQSVSWVDIYSAYAHVSKMLKDVQDDTITAQDFQKLWTS